MGTFNEEPLRERFELDEAETALLAGAETGTTAQISKTQAWSTVYSAKILGETIDTMRQSNEQIATSNEKYAKALNRATWALVACTAALVLVSLIQFI